MSAMTKPFSHSWTPEKLAQMSRADVETLRQNAIRLNAADLIELCEGDLLKRGPRPTRIRKGQPDHSEIDVVTGYHFVCGNDLGVTKLPDGRFWSGSWVVAEDNVRASIKYGAYLALHESKSDLSYRQGKILDFRRASRGMVSKTEDGVEFLVQATTTSYEWIGGGAGKKGYRWTKVVAARPAPGEAFES